MLNVDERDFEEERYNADLCPLCDYSPCIGGQGKGSCGQLDPIVHDCGERRLW